MRASCLLLTLVAGVAAGAPSETRPAAPGAEDDPLKVYARGDYAGVVRLLEPEHRSGTASIQRRLILARAQLHLGRRDAAMEVLRSVLKSDPENPEANALTGRLLHEAGRHKDALEYLERAYRLKRDPATAGVLGRCHYALGSPAKAKVYMEKALAEDIRDPRNSFFLGTICLERGFGALAEKHFLAAEEAGMDTPDLHRLLGRAYVLQRKFAGPILIRRIARAAKPGDVVDDHVVLAPRPGAAEQYRVCTRYSALFEGLRLLAAEPGSLDARQFLAEGFLAGGRADLAAAHAEALAAGEKASRRALDLAVRLALARKDYAALERALSAGRKAKVFGPREAADAWVRAGLALRAEGKRDQAIAMLKKAEAATPTDARVLRALGTLARVTGRRAEARRYYERMVELFPDAADIDELRNTLKVLQEKTGGTR